MIGEPDHQVKITLREYLISHRCQLQQKNLQKFQRYRKQAGLGISHKQLKLPKEVRYEATLQQKLKQIKLFVRANIKDHQKFAQFYRMISDLQEFLKLEIKQENFKQQLMEQLNKMKSKVYIDSQEEQENLQNMNEKQAYHLFGKIFKNIFMDENPQSDEQDFQNLEHKKDILFPKGQYKKMKSSRSDFEHKPYSIASSRLFPSLMNPKK